MNNNNNDAKINNNYGSLQDLILLFKIPLGKRKNFFELYKQFGHAPKKGSLAMVCALLCIRNQVSHPYKTTDVIIGLCSCACLVREQTLRQVMLKRRGVAVPRIDCGIVSRTL
jgi:hypothetical protein